MAVVREKPLLVLGGSLWLVAAQRLHRKVAAVPEHQFPQWIQSGFLCTKVEVCYKHSSLAPVSRLALRKSAFPHRCCLRKTAGRNQAWKRQSGKKNILFKRVVLKMIPYWLINYTILGFLLYSLQWPFFSRTKKNYPLNHFITSRTKKSFQIVKFWENW